MRLIRDLGCWVGALACWLGEAWRVWAFILVVMLFFSGVLLLPRTLADGLRYCGLGFQMIGIVTVARGLCAKGRSFGRSLLLKNIRRWWNRRPRWRAKLQTLLATGIASTSAVGGAKLSMWRGTPADASVEVRVAALEENLTTLRTEQAETANEFQEALSKMNRDVDAERQARVASAAALREQFKKLAVGGLHIEWIGVLCFAVGAFLATVPGEIAAVLRCCLR